MKRTYLSLSLIFLFWNMSGVLKAQCFQAADECNAINCVFGEIELESQGWNNNYYKHLESTQYGFCGTLESSMWFAVIADSSQLDITLTPSNCEVANGLQMALYAEPCDSFPLICNMGFTGGGNTPMSISAAVDSGTVYYLLVDGFAGDICDFTLATNGLGESGNKSLYQSVLVQTLIDNNADCTVDSMDTPAPYIPVTFKQASGLSITRATKENGVTSFYLADSVATVSLEQLPSNLWQVCQDSLQIQVDTLVDTILVQYLLKPLALCPKMQVDLNAPPFLRACQQISLVARYCNTGTATAENATLQMLVPQALQNIVASLPIAAQNGDTLTFQLGDVPPLYCGDLKITANLPCNGNLLGQTLCFGAQVPPDSLCLPDSSGWSGASIALSAECLGDTLVQFTLTNIGSAPTAPDLRYIIIEDEVVLKDGKFTLDPSQSMPVKTPANGSTWRLEAEQEPKHPGISMPSIALEGCGGLNNPGLVNAFPLDDADVFIDLECRQVIGSYDPNIKVASPAGVGLQHVIRPNVPLEYTIHFQNTGTDTAFQVRLLDVLPPTLDPKTFRPGTASHPYSWQILGVDTLEVLFSPIALPDSFKNEPASKGWFEFSIAQQPDLPKGTLLENAAAIYFDYNAPVITPAAWHTVESLTVSIDDPIHQPDLWQVLGNPVAATCTFLSKNPSFNGPSHFELYDAWGRLLRTDIFYGARYVFERQNLADGMYLFRLSSVDNGVFSGKIMLGAR